MSAAEKKPFVVTGSEAIAGYRKELTLSVRDTAVGIDNANIRPVRLILRAILFLPSWLEIGIPAN